MDSEPAQAFDSADTDMGVVVVTVLCVSKSGRDPDIIKMASIKCIEANTTMCERSNPLRWVGRRLDVRKKSLRDSKTWQ